MRDDFDKEAMREKIKKNLDAGFTIIGIQVALQSEQISNLEQMAILEARNIELQDQIEFMKQEYGNKLNLGSEN